jgi:hypothetical protein
VLHVNQLFGKLRDGVSVDAANAEMRVRYAPRSGDGPDRGLQIARGIASPLPRSAYIVIAATLAVGGLVAAIAAASLTLLLLAKASTSLADMAIRLTIGASATDITRLLAIEVGLVAITAALVGLPIGYAFAELASRHFMAASELGSSGLDPSPDWRVFLYVFLGTCSLCVVVVRIVARHNSRMDALSALASAAGAGGATSRATPSRTRLIASQVAAVTVLLFVAALFVRSTLAGLTVDSGFDSSDVAIAWIDQTATGGDLDAAER